MDFRFRLREHKARPKALEALKQSLNLSRSFLAQIKNLTDKEEIYTTKDLDDINKVINETTVRLFPRNLLFYRFHVDFFLALSDTFFFFLF